MQAALINRPELEGVDDPSSRREVDHVEARLRGPNTSFIIEDVVFPVPWRVQIEIVEPPVPDPPAVSTGIPAQAVTNSAAYPTNSLVTDMIQRGSVLIDELSGKVYEVTSREVDPSAPTPRAIVTLDQEITLAEWTQYGALRTVWVFPPPAERDPSGAVIGFTGPQPVVGVEVRRMSFWP